MDRTESTIRKLFAALPAHGYDLGILLNDRMQRFAAVSGHRLLHLLPYLKHHNANGAHIFLRPTGESAYTLLDDLPSAALSRMVSEGFAPAAVVETSPDNYQAWLRHIEPLSAELGTLAAKMLAERFGADHSAADWRRFGRAPGFTNRKLRHCDARGLYPYARLKSNAGEAFAFAGDFHNDLLVTYKAKKEAESQRRLASRSRRVSFAPLLSIARFRNARRYYGRPAAADMAFSICAVAHGWTEEDIAHALRAEYLSRNPDRRAQNAYIRRTVSKAQGWAA